MGIRLWSKSLWAVYTINHIRTTFFNSGTTHCPQGNGDAKNWLLLVKWSQRRAHRLAMLTVDLRWTQMKAGHTWCQCGLDQRQHYPQSSDWWLSHSWSEPHCLGFPSPFRYTKWFSCPSQASCYCSRLAFSSYAAVGTNTWVVIWGYIHDTATPVSPRGL